MLVLRYALDMTQRCQFKGSLELAQKKKRIRVANLYLRNVGARLQLSECRVFLSVGRVPAANIPMTHAMLRDLLVPVQP